MTAGRPPRIVYWNNIAAPYMVDRFNAVARAGRLAFEGWFSRHNDRDRGWEVRQRDWRFRHRVLAPRSIAGHAPAVPWPLLVGPRPGLLVALYAEPVFVAGWLLAKARRVPVLFWCEVTFDSWVSRRAWKTRLRRAMFRSAAGIVTAGEDGRAFAIQAGADPRRVFILPHAIDVPFFEAAAATAAAGRDATRARLGLSGRTLLYVGRFRREKGIDDLLTAFASLVREEPGAWSLLLVGDGPDEARLRRRVANERIAGVTIEGFQQHAELTARYAAADLFVFPSLGDPYGLVVDEALASGLPVVATTSCGEIRTRVVEGVNGWLVPPGDPEALAAAIRTWAAAGLGPRQDRLPGPLRTRTPDSWAADFAAIVESVLGR